ncbi:MAG: bifunctional anthranilate synthase component II/anthranilate phosphoribosyltransferase [Acetatifactor sp.]
MILLIDNYDSFSYNVYQLTASVNSDVMVIRNDQLSVQEIEELNPTHIILSPGPGRPSEAGVCEDVIRYFAGRIPILGICLGHQAICEVFGATVTYAKQLMHGKQSVATLDTDSVLFAGMKEQMTVARYHSLAADAATMPGVLKITARTEDGEVMAVEHREYPVYGVQFHPESVLTPDGRQIMENFLKPGASGNAEERKTVAKNISEKNTEDQKIEEKGEKKMMIQEAIIKLSKKEDIGYEMAKGVMNEIMNGEASDVQKSAYLTALSMKGETIEEITGSAEEMRNHALPVNHGMDVMEIVGTGGDGSNSFNISTTAALIIAAAGVPVAKHGNRAASSKSGAADCLESLGVNIALEPEKAVKLLREAGICFLFAQKYHTAMKYVGPIRKELGIRTVFNILGPLTNPAKASMQIMGVYDESLLEPMAHVLSNLGVKKGMVVYGQEKLDEISICGPTSVCCFKNGEFRKDTITPESVGLKRAEKGELLGGTPEENAAITRAILEGKEKGAKRDAAVINAAAALFVAGKAGSLQSAVKLAEDTIDSGKALTKLEQFVQLSNA